MHRMEELGQEPGLEQEEETKHPGWQVLGEILNSHDPLFRSVRFLQGYDFSSNIYLLDGPSMTLVDPANDYTAFTDLHRQGIDLSRIRKIAVTHGHRDHVMGAFELLRAYPAVAEAGGFELIAHEAAPQEMKDIVRQLGCRVREVTGGEVIELSGFEWEIIHTPGHTIDSICFYHAPSKTVITGDTVLPHSMAEADKSAGGEIQHYLYSLKALLKKDVENVWPGHGAPVFNFGRRVIEETYEGVMLKLLGVEKQIRWMDGARGLVQRGLLEEAVYCCDKEMALPSPDLEALKLKGLCLNDLGRFHEALDTFEQLEQRISHPDRDAYLKVGKGYALMGLGNYLESLRFLEEALAIKPGMPEALVYKGMTLYLSGKPEEALEIEPFRMEFMDRFKSQLEQHAKL
ncbi:MAG: MBL fold metallo-hydrolase [Deltaproteobacteria bacterium]|nr:MBL fold metallo-hydrolase [Deltaproteobacteria bacterium]